MHTPDIDAAFHPVARDAVMPVFFPAHGMDHCPERRRFRKWSPTSPNAANCENGLILKQINTKIGKARNVAGG